MLGGESAIQALPSVNATQWVGLPERLADRSEFLKLKPSGVATWLSAHGYAGVLVSDFAGKRDSLGVLATQLSAFGVVDGLSGAYLSEGVALYVVDRLSGMPEQYGPVLAEVARRMLSGAVPPRVQSFPSLLREVQNVEVMVLLRSGSRHRLWRSARGSSFARAFLTAVRVAKRRWYERQQAMGGTLPDTLPSLTVEVALLRDDGEVGTRSAKFLDSVVSEEHGVAYERKGSWRYLLPKATAQQGKGKPSVALRQLLADGGMGAMAFAEGSVRVRRLLVKSVGVSPPPFRGDTSALELVLPVHPDSVLANSPD